MSLIICRGVAVAVKGQLVRSSGRLFVLAVDGVGLRRAVGGHAGLIAHSIERITLAGIAVAVQRADGVQGRPIVAAGTQGAAAKRQQLIGVVVGCVVVTTGAAVGMV